MENGLLHDPMFFYAVAFGIFIVLAIVYGRKPITGFIDGEIAKIRAELDEARALRVEAEKALHDYKAKQNAAMTEAENIIRQAQDEAARLRAQAQADLKTSLARQESQVADRIRAAETEATDAVRKAAIDLALKLAEDHLSQSADAGKLTEQALAEIPGLFRKPAKAA